VTQVTVTNMNHEWTLWWF